MQTMCHHPVRYAWMSGSGPAIHPVWLCQEQHTRLRVPRGKSIIMLFFATPPSTEQLLCTVPRPRHRRLADTASAKQPPTRRSRWLVHTPLTLHTQKLHSSEPLSSTLKGAPHPQQSSPHSAELPTLSRDPHPQQSSPHSAELPTLSRAPHPQQSPPLPVDLNAPQKAFPPLPLTQLPSPRPCMAGGCRHML
eukprot:366113-Chlamydomonas_euryale.AAC.21